MCVYLYWVDCGTAQDTRIFVEREVGGAAARHRSVGHPSVGPGVWVIGCYFHNRGSGGTVGAEADGVEDRIEDGPVVVDVHHRDPHMGY